MQQPATSEFWLRIIFPFGLAYFICAALRSINAILAHPITESLEINAHQIGFITAIFALTFAAAQLPLGVLLDKWGATKTQASFYFIGAIGMITFGLAENFWILALGRAVLGIGMAGGLMAAFKVVADYVEKQRIPFYNGVVLAAGGLGALFATTPCKLIQLHFGWRELCVSLGILTALAALIIAILGPKQRSSTDASMNFWHELKGFKEIYKSRYIWRITPVFASSFGGFLAMQGLWLDGWLRGVNKLSPLQAANYLLAIALAMTFGMVSGGLYAWLADRFRISLSAATMTGIAIHIVTQIAIILNVFPNNYILWMIYGYFATVSLLCFALIVQHYDPKISGRAITAVNIFIFIFIFVVQYTFGIIIHLWPSNAAGEVPVLAYQVAFGSLVLIELASFAWYLWFRKP